MRWLSIYDGIYMAIAIWFARKLVDKLGLDTGRLCVVMDFPDTPYIIVGMANRGNTPGQKEDHIKLITEDELVETERDTITLMEAAYRYPEKWKSASQVSTFQGNRKAVGAAITRIRRRKGKKVLK